MPLLLSLAVAGPRMSVAQWRAAVHGDRALAENDVPRAYAEAVRLQATLPAGASRADRALAFNLLARTEIYSGLTGQADAHAKQALALARRAGDRIGQAEADLNLALSSVNLGRIDELSAAAPDAVAVLQGVSAPDLTGEALLRLAMLYLRLGQIDKAVTTSMRAMDIARRNRNSLALTYAAQGMGVAFGQAGRPADARRYFSQMLQEARVAHSRLLEGDALTSLSAFGQMAEAEPLQRQAIAIYRQVGAPLSVNVGLMSLANLLRDHGRYREARQLYDPVIATYQRYPTPIGLWYALNGRCLNEQSLGDRTAARADAVRMYALAKQIGFPTYISQSAQRLGSLAAGADDFRRLLAAADTIASRSLGTQHTDLMGELASQYERESREQEIEALRRRNQEQTAELRQRLRQRTLEERLLLTMLCGAVALAAITGFFVLRFRRLNAGLERRVQDRTAELRQQASYLRTLIDTLPLRIWMKDTDSRYLAANRAEAEASGRPVEQMVGRSDGDLWPPDIAEAHRAGDREVMARRRRAKVEEALPGKDGAQWVETYRAPVLDEDGTLLGTVGASSDISERKAAEAAREAALAEARRLVRLRSDFMAQMSHELRTPLNGILGYTALLERDRDLGERQKAALEVIRQSGEHLLALINEVLDFARIEAGKLELEKAPLALGPFLRSIAGLMSARAQLKGLTVTLEVAPEVPEAIVADERRLRQVLLNLLANAVAFTDRGSVCLRVSCPAPQRLRFEVRDTGVGIPSAQLETIFQPFEQVTEGQRRGGTGLGLPISRRYVRMMGGDIEVESRVGVGSTFRFELAAQAVAVPAGIASLAPGDLPAAMTGEGRLPPWAASGTAEEGVVPPPPAQIERLHALALEGNMRDILRWAAQLTELEGQRYRHFALRVRFLAERYQSQAILTLAKRCLETAAG